MKDAKAEYLREIAEIREMLDCRYDDVESGRVALIDGEAFFDSLRKRRSELLEKLKVK